MSPLPDCGLAPARAGASRLSIAGRSAGLPCPALGRDLPAPVAAVDEVGRAPLVVFRSNCSRSSVRQAVRQLRILADERCAHALDRRAARRPSPNSWARRSPLTAFLVASRTVRTVSSKLTPTAQQRRGDVQLRGVDALSPAPPKRIELRRSSTSTGPAPSSSS